MEQISLGNRYKECRPRRTSSCQTKILVGKDVLHELEQRHSSPSVIAKLMGIDVLPPSNVVNSRHQEFKDVFEVSEEPPEAVTKERSHHFPKGLPSLKQRAVRLKKLMPSKTLYRDDTHDCHVDCTDGLGRLNSVEINNPLFEKRPHDMNYSANYQYGKDTSSVCMTYPVGLANSSLSNFSLLSRGKNKDFNSIVVLEPPCLEKGHDPENVFSIPYLSPLNKNCRRGMKHKQSEFPVMENGRDWQHILSTEDNNVPRIRKERFLTSDPIDPLQIGQEASVHQFGNTDASCPGSSQRYSCGNDNFRQTNRSSSNSTLLKMRRHAESAVGSKTLAEMFALSDSEKLKLNSDSRAPIRRNMIDRDNGHSKDGCFIVLPKHAPLQSIRSSMDRNSCSEGSSQGKNNSNISNIYNNGKCQFDSFPDKPRLLKQIGSGSEAHLSNACCFQNLTADNFSTPDCLNEKVLFTTDVDLVQQPAESEASGFNLQVSRKQRVTILPFRCHEDESISISISDHTDGIKSCKGSKEVEQPSPVSILEPPIDDDICFPGCLNYDDLQGMAKKQRDGHQYHNESEITMSSDDEDHSFYQSLEAFQVEENWDFSYLLDILICSGIIVADWQLICKSWYLPGCPVGPHVFDRLERKYNKITTWAKPERRLLFDLVNSILSEVLAPCVDVHPWVQPSRHRVALWGPEGPVEKVWQTIVRQREDCVTGNPDEMVLDTNWLEVGNDINMVGKQISRMLHGDLLEEVIVDFLG
ncbi:unnamed protein product [Miscanthus lutarioriparius]|uniref:DUF4378 domain-containing protein n=1 Tax=Miscanthus lutarioriparius TaxID=422564 RepID=A0A811RJM1_9POAL|nr:unnamed protein product [Miscanthus lutarioriparius]